MAIFISTLAKGMDHVEQIAHMVDNWNQSELGVELIAFTHDEQYWKRLEALLPLLRCPVTFHGPYIGVEGTAPVGTPEYEHLFASYNSVFELAARYAVRHIVFHTTQLGWSAYELNNVRQQSYANIQRLTQMAQSYGVDMLVENLPYPSVELPLYDNEAYGTFFEDFPQIHSLIDIGHAHMNGLQLDRLLPALNKRILGYHFHNNDGQRDLHNRILDGTFRYDTFGKLYRASTPCANIVLEYEPHTHCTEQDFLDDIQTVRELVLGD